MSAPGPVPMSIGRRSSERLASRSQESNRSQRINSAQEGRKSHESNKSRGSTVSYRDEDGQLKADTQPVVPDNAEERNHGGDEQGGEASKEGERFQSPISFIDDVENMEDLFGEPGDGSEPGINALRSGIDEPEPMAGGHPITDKESMRAYSNDKYSVKFYRETLASNTLKSGSNIAELKKFLTWIGRERGEDLYQEDEKKKSLCDKASAACTTWRETYPAEARRLRDLEQEIKREDKAATTGKQTTTQNRKRPAKTVIDDQAVNNQEPPTKKRKKTEKEVPRPAPAAETIEGEPNSSHQSQDGEDPTAFVKKIVLTMKQAMHDMESARDNADSLSDSGEDRALVELDHGAVAVVIDPESLIKPPRRSWMPFDAHIDMQQVIEAREIIRSQKAQNTYKEKTGRKYDENFLKFKNKKKLLVDKTAKKIVEVSKKAAYRTTSASRAQAAATQIIESAFPLDTRRVSDKHGNEGGNNDDNDGGKDDDKENADVDEAANEVSIDGDSDLYAHEDDSD